MLRTSFAALALLGSGAAIAAPAAGAKVPTYAHIYVIIEENHTFDQVVGQKYAPNFNKFAKQYGLATNFFAERHPSEPNYIAILGGDTFGVADDDAYWCKRGQAWSKNCDNSIVVSGGGNKPNPDYVDHTITARSLIDQLNDKKLTWKGYFEDIPAPGSGENHWPSAANPQAGQPNMLYAVKHNGFMFYKTVQDDPQRAQKIVGFDVLTRDAANGTLPNYAHIVPNQCNDMHGLVGANVPDDCDKGDDPDMMARSDKQLGELVAKIMSGPQWKAKGNSAIVVTFDENEAGRPDNHGDGCCGSLAGDRNNPGGGWIPTVVITNHGPRSVEDATPHNHYSLLRTTEDAFGIKEHIGHAADEAKGVVPMTKLFAVSGQ